MFYVLRIFAVHFIDEDLTVFQFIRLTYVLGVGNNILSQEYRISYRDAKIIPLHYVLWEKNICGTVYRCYATSKIMKL